MRGSCSDKVDEGAKLRDGSCGDSSNLRLRQSRSPIPWSRSGKRRDMSGNHPQRSPSRDTHFDDDHLFRITESRPAPCCIRPDHDHQPKNPARSGPAMDLGASGVAHLPHLGQPVGKRHGRQLAPPAPAGVSLRRRSGRGPSPLSARYLAEFGNWFRDAVTKSPARDRKLIGQSGAQGGGVPGGAQQGVHNQATPQLPSPSPRDCRHALPAVAPLR